MFQEFLNKSIKATYKDGTQFKVARGILREVDDQFLKVDGKLGIIIIQKKKVEKVSLWEE